MQHCPTFQRNMSGMTCPMALRIEQETPVLCLKISKESCSRVPLFYQVLKMIKAACSGVVEPCLYSQIFRITQSLKYMCICSTGLQPWKAERQPLPPVSRPWLSGGGKWSRQRLRCSAGSSKPPKQQPNWRFVFPAVHVNPLMRLKSP